VAEPPRRLRLQAQPLFPDTGFAPLVQHGQTQESLRQYSQISEALPSTQSSAAAVKLLNLQLVRIN
jgi:hypothetical protein